MKDILVLTDKTQIEIESGSTLDSISVIFSDKESMIQSWDKMTQDNLKYVKITDGNDVKIAEYNDLVLSYVTSIEQEDGTILTTFTFREKTEVELLKEQAAIQAEQMEVLTACVLEMSEAVYA